MQLKLVLVGLGGQGVTFTTRLLAQAATVLGHSVMASEIHGMSQRGGSVIAHLKIDGDEAPLIRRGTADLLLALEPDEAVRNLSFPRRGGTVFVGAEDGLRPEVTGHLQRLHIQVRSLPASGMALAHPSLPLPIDAVRETLAAIAPRDRELNLQALDEGYRAGRAQGVNNAGREVNRG
jgi:indolepyruvate ferredoxin oxidoreductase beta subunit